MADFLANSVVTSSNAAATNTLAAAVSSSSNNSGGGFALRFEPSGMTQSFSATVSQPHDASNPSASSVLAALRLAAAAAVTTASPTAAPMSPVKIDDYTSGSGNGALGLDYGNNTTACSSRASSFSSKLNNLYLSSLPESLIFPLISQQQQQRENISLPLTTTNSSSSTQSATAAAAAAAAAAGLSRTATHSIFNLTPPDESRLSAFRARSATTATTMFNHNNQHQQLYFGGNDTNSANGSNNNNNAVDAIMVDDMDSGFGGSALSTVSSLSNGNLAQSLPPNLNLFLNNFIAGNNGFGPLAELNTSSTASVTSLASNLSTNVGSSAQSASFPAFSPPPSSLTSQLAVKHTVASPQSSHNANDALESGSVSGASNATTVPPTAAGALSTYTFGASRSSSESSTTADSAAVTPTDAAVTTTAKQSLSTLFGGASSRKHMNSVASTKMDSSSPSPAGFSGNGGSKLSPLKMKAHIRNNSSKIECPSTTPPGSSAAVAQQHNQQQQQHMDDDQSNICNVCGDEASGRHYGASTCFGCKGFFRRTVRANKTYNCRYEERCEIDKVGRNICRSCRFRKCLDVGMEPDAIRPDRDKTGRQKNPRRSSVMSASGSNYPSALPHTGGSVEMSSSALASLAGVELLPNIYGLNGEEKPASQTQQTRKQSSADTASGAEAMVAERDMVIETLLEIERICANLRDPQEFVEYESNNNNNNEATTSGDDQCECSITASRRRSGCNDAAILADISRVFSQPLLLSARSPLDYSGQYGPLNLGMNGADEQRKPKAVRRECCCRRDFHDAFKRVATLAVDYANTLKPIADIDIHQRERLVRSFISSFVVFSSAYQSVAGTRGGITAARRDSSSSSSSSSSAILLPNGRYVDADTPFACFVDDRSLSESVAQSLQSKISFVCRQIVECVESRMERMRVTDVEYVCLKAIIVLDPSTAGLRAETADVLAVARDSVQNALFLHVMEKCTTSQSAIFRFGQLLMLIANVSKIGAFLSNTIEMCGTHLANTDRASGGGYKKTSTWWSAGSPAMALFVGAENHGGYSSVVGGVALEADAASAGWEMKMDEDESGADSADDDDADDDEDDEVAGGGAGNTTMEPRGKYGGDGGGQPPPPQRDREEDCAMLLI